MKYNTVQKKQIIEVLKNSNKALTVKQILESLNAQNIEVGRTTVYRHLKDLEEEENIEKVRVYNETGYIYSAECHENHVHVLCENCGDVEHVETEEIKVLCNTQIDLFKSKLLGVCANCRKGDMV